MSSKANMNTQAQDVEYANTINSGKTGTAKRKNKPGRPKKKKAAKETDVHICPTCSHMSDILPLHFLGGRASQSRKQRKSLNSFLQLTAELPFDTLKAQLLAQILAKLNPSKISYDDYDIVWTVPRIQPSPLALALDSDYKFLLQHAIKHKELQTNITIKARTNKKKKMRKDTSSGEDDVGSENESEDDKQLKKKPKKTSAKEKAKNKDKAQANLETPPNHAKFNTLPGQKGTISLLQCHLAEHAQPASQPHAPNNNIPQPAPAGSCTEGGQSDSLIPYGMLHGPTLSLNDFYSNYTLSDDIHMKLHQNRYTGMETICYILVSELKEMEFKLGEIAVMRPAMKCWCR
ncbi:uncharacterized protein F5891DRAFT_981803 [Suillus fuscotomentosus]|uniref:Uncharacterized protein n=1 Tax=Suillus fuscotomentosus TaxID=1912939 RepID=A0AAD4HJP5_9AGAM|nr:uncharacterized protein F5891DRAFT_981803 [Suillus fuscotomentosus]KAG1898661.1 hypothetical protein F5891DRAFT_981803 [Suillus fuscotomentosus]